MISDVIYARFLSDLAAIVNDKGPWDAKADALRARMDDSDAANLEELMSWGITGEETTEVYPEEDPEV